MEAAVPAATSQGASGSSEMPDGLPLLPAAAPPPTSQGANSNSDPEAMIRVQWMHHPRPASVPAPLKACRHNHPEWFTERFSHEAPGSEKFTGAKDIDWANHWSQDKLWAACTGASTSWDLPDSGEASLYQLLKERPDVQMDYHNPPGSGAFYVRFGCANCKCMTPVYQRRSIGDAHETKVESLQSRVALLEKAHETILESFKIACHVCAHPGQEGLAATVSGPQASNIAFHTRSLRAAE